MHALRALLRSCLGTHKGLLSGKHASLYYPGITSLTAAPPSCIQCDFIVDEVQSCGCEDRTRTMQQSQTSIAYLLRGCVVNDRVHDSYTECWPGHDHRRLHKPKVQDEATRTTQYSMTTGRSPGMAAAASFCKNKQPSPLQRCL